ncbi:hypothetical protein QYE76_023850 [Lolium multiflorum]|uniref:Retrotransposon gag domain-containing protein n=1 Tax=Lolium multiflorum TaxID=4521 RepID=A0AAD8VVG7_LOLMU|nr:hypothetical protein QYE76_023850 [Lolium multiflorum]
MTQILRLLMEDRQRARQEVKPTSLPFGRLLKPPRETATMKKEKDTARKPQGSSCHSLSGPARAWWENVKAMQAADHVITWEEFTTKFRKAHIPTGLIKMKRDEFFNLKQNNSNVVDYLDKFNTLARYAPQDTDTDEKKRDRFMNGLHEEIQSILVAVPYPDLEALVDAAIMVESKRKAAYETRKRKMQQQQSGPSNPKYRSPPPSRPANPPQRTPASAPVYRSNNNTPTVQLHSTVPEEEVTTTTPAPIPQLVLKEMDVSLVGSLGTSLVSALPR